MLLLLIGPPANAGTIFDSRSVTVSLEDARYLATSAILTKEPTLNMSQMYPFETKILDHGLGKEYSFTWVEKQDDVLLFTNAINIRINPETGQVISFHRTNKPTEITIRPQVSQLEAENIAKTRTPFNPSRIDSYLALLEPQDGQQELWWIVRIDGQSVYNIRQVALIRINALNGKVVSQTHGR